MRIGGGCGGILGRDCFNEMECIQISNSMDNTYELEQENELLRNKIKELQSLLVAHGILHEPTEQ